MNTKSITLTTLSLLAACGATLAEDGAMPAARGGQFGPLNRLVTAGAFACSSLDAGGEVPTWITKKTR